MYEPTGLRLRHIGKTDPQCGTVQFCFHSGRLTCSARTGFRAVTTPLYGGQMSAMVIFRGHVSGEVTNAQHALHINVTYDFNSIILPA